jgi:hypothetical protein
MNQKKISSTSTAEKRREKTEKTLVFFLAKKLMQHVDISSMKFMKEIPSPNKKIETGRK